MLRVMGKLFQINTTRESLFAQSSQSSCCINGISHLYAYWILHWAMLLVLKNMSCIKCYFFFQFNSWIKVFLCEINSKEKKGRLREKLILWHVRIQNTGDELNSAMALIVIYLEICWKLLVLVYSFMWVELTEAQVHREVDEDSITMETLTWIPKIWAS